MDTVPLPTKILRIDSRYRHQAQDVARRDAASVQVEEEEETSRGAGEPLLIREQKGRVIMGKAHRLFHRRQVHATANVLTINVEVIATLDSAGNVLGKVTSTPALEATAAAALPSVPSVPPFPSDLNVPSVPAFPWPSGVPTAVTTTGETPTAGTAETSVQPVMSLTSVPTSTPLSILTSVDTFPSASSYNLTTTRTTSSSTLLSLNTTSSRSSSSTSSSASSTYSSPSSSRTSTQSSITSSLTSSLESTSPTLSASSTAEVGGGGGGGGGSIVDPGNTAAPAPTGSTVPITNAGSSSPLETPQVVGTVVGSVAGVAILAFLILFLIKRHKQKRNGGALQLTGDDHTDNSQPVTQNPARTSFIPPSFLNRFSGASRSTAESSGTGERSFQRISGRKLPSAFSEGITSEQVAAGRGEGTLSGSSFYQDDKGFYGGAGVLSKDFGEMSPFDKEIGETSNRGAIGTEARVRPSPAQTPVIRHADDTPVWGAPHNSGGTLSPPLTPSFPPRDSLGRSHPSRDGSTISRSSRFTENV
ncbi:hypothetical protein BU23DRAFT_301664 [Bimuria novae-zelandiae CBS 107.79]|uniref:Uncharacterized protein n=1 Tax=Bimuria novae-zelandiae CBS 107.79 TaxID=1447943 RepID=A0A6A5UR14_9PLEO|nr:hypothetical protein BU23DRAFT_301664 [Bimuria novae-zelandiae CBS 107.79]